jgi:hypothetical protein
MAGNQGVSLKPKDAVQGGLADNVHVKWDEVRFVQWDYNGKVTPPVLALAIAMHELADPNSKFVQYYSAGDLKNLVPSSDGRRAVPVGSQAGLNNNTNAMQLIESLCNAAPQFEDMMTDDVAATFENMECYMERVAQPKRTGLLNRPGQTQQQQGGNDTVLVVKKVYRLPNGTQLEAPPANMVASGAGSSRGAAGKPNGQGGQPTSAPSGPPAGAPAVAAAPSLPASTPAPAGTANGNDAAMTAEAEGVIGTIIAESGPGGLAKKALPGKLFQKLANDVNRNAIVALAGNAGWIGAAERPWQLANDNLAFPS